MTPDPSADPNPDSQKLGTVKGEMIVDYEKSNLFRVIHVDGAAAGLSPIGDYLVFSIFNERRPIPKRDIIPLDDLGFPAGHPQQTTRPAHMYREVEASLMMNLETAESLLRLLKDHVAMMKRAAVMKADALKKARDLGRKPPWEVDAQ